MILHPEILFSSWLEQWSLDPRNFVYTNEKRMSSEGPVWRAFIYNLWGWSIILSLCLGVAQQTFQRRQLVYHLDVVFYNAPGKHFKKSFSTRMESNIESEMLFHVWMCWLIFWSGTWSFSDYSIFIVEKIDSSLLRVVGLRWRRLWWQKLSCCHALRVGFFKKI